MNITWLCVGEKNTPFPVTPTSLVTLPRALHQPTFWGWCYQWAQDFPCFPQTPLVEGAWVLKKCNTGHASLTLHLTSAEEICHKDGGGRDYDDMKLDSCQEGRRKRMGQGPSHLAITTSSSSSVFLSEIILQPTLFPLTHAVLTLTASQFSSLRSQLAPLQGLSEAYSQFPAAAPAAGCMIWITHPVPFH